MTGSRSCMSHKARARASGAAAKTAILTIAGGIVLIGFVAGALLGGFELFAKGSGRVPESLRGKARFDRAVSATTLSVPTTAGPTAATAAKTSALSVESTAKPAIEVPSVIGKPVEEAEMLLAAAGLLVQRRLVDERDTGLVSFQDPPAGALVKAGTSVVISVPAGAKAQVANEGYIVCIDPGHQSRADLRPEPIGPGASQTKERVRGGAIGVATRLPECEIALQISMNLKQRLEAAGVTVVMTRTTNDVNISNAERAGIANAAGADLFIRVHADSADDQSISGITTLYPAVTRWTSTIAEASKRAAKQIHASTVAATGSISRGTVARDNITGFNYSKVPVVLVECGFMSNPIEDKLLASPHYQDKLAEGMASGILAFLRESKR